MAIYVYAADGELVSYCPGDADPVADADVLKAGGLATVSGLAPLDDTHKWDAATKSVVIVAAPVPIRNISAADFIGLFTPEEDDAIYATADKIVKQWLRMLAVSQQVDLNSQLVTNGLGYLAQIGLLAAARIPQILAGP